MKKIIPYITLLCLTGFTATSGLPVMAGGCRMHMNKKAELKCDEYDTDCQTNKSEDYETDKTIKS